MITARIASAERSAQRQYRIAARARTFGDSRLTIELLTHRLGLIETVQVEEQWCRTGCGSSGIVRRRRKTSVARDRLEALAARDRQRSAFGRRIQRWRRVSRATWCRRDREGRRRCRRCHGRHEHQPHEGSSERHSPCFSSRAFRSSCRGAGPQLRRSFSRCRGACRRSTSRCHSSISQLWRR